MKSNGDKCHLLFITEKSVRIYIYESNVTNKKEQKLLGIKFDSSLSFEGHILSLCKKASQKLHALAKISNPLNLPKRNVPMQAFVYYIPIQYCPLIWVLHINNRINNSTKGLWGWQLKIFSLHFNSFYKKIILWKVITKTYKFYGNL